MTGVIHTCDTGPYGLADTASAQGRGFDPRSGQTKVFTICTLVATSLDASIMRLVLEQVGPVSVYCD